MQRLAMAWRREGRRIAMVPTMGYLHEGHLDLVRIARRTAGRSGRVVVTIYVNPTQFGVGEDHARYPRDLDRDLGLCRDTGVDAVFTPDDASMYPGREEGLYSTYVVEEKLSHGMEGASRPTHFRGVTTVVAKLLHLALPDVAVFGAKDWQQAAVVRRMTRDLNFPVRIVIGPTRREPDGLAMSSRNKYLTGEQREQARVLWQTIVEARKRVRATQGVDPDVLRGELRAFIEQQPEARVDYIAFFQSQTLEPVDHVRPGTHMALAVFVGSTRLIDNARL
jgi:pantoate--beta-alanine ligase